MFSVSRRLNALKKINFNIVATISDTRLKKTLIQED